MALKLLLIYAVGFFIAQPIIMFSLTKLWKMEEDEERAYADDRGEQYEPDKPKGVGVLFLLTFGSLLWPLGILLAIFVPLTFFLMKKTDGIGLDDPGDDEVDPEEDEYF